MPGILHDHSKWDCHPFPGDGRIQPLWKGGSEVAEIICHRPTTATTETTAEHQGGHKEPSDKED
jgi:hypothetical protein